MQRQLLRRDFHYGVGRIPAWPPPKLTPGRVHRRGRRRHRPPSATRPGGEIYLFVRAHPDGVTAAEVAERFALHPNVARHHLEKLAGGGYLDVELARHESAGRPVEALPRRRHATRTSRSRLAATISSARCSPARSSSSPVDEAHALAEEVGYEYGRALAARMEPAEGHRSVKTALASVADALTAHGFAAHTESHGKSLDARRRALPVRRGGEQVPARAVRGRHRA